MGRAYVGVGHFLHLVCVTGHPMQSTVIPWQSGERFPIYKSLYSFTKSLFIDRLLWASWKQAKRSLPSQTLSFSVYRVT